MTKHFLKISFYLFIQLFILICALYIGKEWSNSTNIIPKILFRLPEQPTTADMFSQILNIFMSAGFIFYILAFLKLGPTDFKESKRTIQELFTTLTAFTFSTLYIFFATSIPFSPNFFVGAGLVYFILLIIMQFIFATITKRLSSISSLGKLSKALGYDFIKTVSSLGGILVILFAASPLILMKAYISNRDVANIVTQIRLSLTQEKYEGWMLVNAIEGLTFRQPIMAQFDPSNDGILYILERHGRLYKVNYEAGGEKSLVLDFSNNVADVDMENGALGFDLHPQFGQTTSKNSGFVYIYYTDFSNVTNDQQTNRLSRFNLNEETAQERYASQYSMIEFKRSSDGYHNGGSVEFGPDNFLYLAIGESSNQSSHQKINNKLHGGIFRIDVDQHGGDISHPITRQAFETISQGYFIPSDNPFVGDNDALEEFWALGLRNPFRISFDSKTNKLWAGDVGSTRFEEVNIIEKGGNYQFPYIEGVTTGRGDKPEQYIGIEKGPAYFYEHTAYERSIIGGLVYRDTALGELTDKYIYMDNYSGRIYSLNADDDILTEPQTLTRSEQVAQRGITSFITAANGDILMTALGRSQDQSGRLLKLVPTSKMALEQLKKEEDIASEPSQIPIDVVKLYNVSCARCHGTDGTGDGPDRDLLETPLPDFTDEEFQNSRSDDQLYNVIKIGGDELGLSFEMPPWDGLLEEDEMKEITKYLRTLGKH